MFKNVGRFTVTSLLTSPPRSGQSRAHRALQGPQGTHLQVHTGAVAEQNIGLGKTAIFCPHVESSRCSRPPLACQCSAVRPLCRPTPRADRPALRHGRNRRGEAIQSGAAAFVESYCLCSAPPLGWGSRWGCVVCSSPGELLLWSS